MLSICIPVYNYNITELVTELHNQCSVLNIDFEIIALDDASNKEEIQLENKLIDLPNFKLIENQTNIGNTKIRNSLIEYSNYNWVLFLDADTFPVNSQFIAHYINEIQEIKIDLISGGITYKEYPNCNQNLRWKYGFKKETFKSNSNPYLNIYGANFLIRKSCFPTEIKVQLPKKYGYEEVLWGMDLKSNHKTIKIIDNPVYHLGIDMPIDFINKYKQSIENALFLYKNYPEYSEEINLIQSYKRIKQFKINTIIGKIFPLIEPILLRNLTSKNPSIFLFQLFKLSYLCSLVSK